VCIWQQKLGLLKLIAKSTHWKVSNRKSAGK